MKHLLQLILFVAVLVFPAFAKAQFSAPPLKGFAIGIKPAGIVDPFVTNITFCGLYGINNNLIAEIQAGRIYSWMTPETNFERNSYKRGWKAGAELKYIFSYDFYLSTHFFLNRYTTTFEEAVSRQNFAYWEYIEIDREFTVTGFHLKVGAFLTSEKSPFFADIYAGVGFRQRTMEIKNVPQDALLVSDEVLGWPFFLQNQNQDSRITTPSVSLGVTLGLKLRSLRRADKEN